MVLGGIHKLDAKKWLLAKKIAYNKNLQFLPNQAEIQVILPILPTF